MTPQQQAEAALRQAGCSDPVQAASLMAPIISPMRRAADWLCLRVTTASDAWFIKLPAGDAGPSVSPAGAAQAANAAAALGVGPAVRFALPDSGAMGLGLLAPPWREARLSDLAEPAMLQALLAAKAKFRAGPPLQRSWDVFTEIDQAASALRTGPADLPRLLAEAGRIRSAFAAAGRDTAPCHNDGAASNIMLGPGGQVMLVDFDCAGMADPHYDVGTVLNEACEADADWDRGLEMAFGSTRPQARHRCRAYAVADDLFWGVWGLSQHESSPRTGPEFLKYGSWRLLRCRMALDRSDHAAMLRAL